MMLGSIDENPRLIIDQLLGGVLLMIYFGFVC